MSNIDDFVRELAVIIDENAEGFGIVRTFKVDAVEKEWIALNNGVDFKTALNKLIARNKIGMVAKNICEIRDTERTD